MRNGEKLASSSAMKERSIASVSEKDEGKSVLLAGWAHNVREMGALAFLTLRDGSGRIQVKLSAKPEEKIEKESAVQVRGKVKKDARAPNGIEIEAESVKVVGKIYDQPPFYPAQKDEPNLNVRLDNRSLDLRREKTRAIFDVRATLESAFRESLLALDFEEINPACIVGSSTEGGAQLFKIDYFDRPAFLAQSPQFYKQLAVIGGIERVFMTTPVFRAEKHEGPYHINEIHQMDIEMAFADDNDALAILEEVFLHMLRSVAQKNAAGLKTLGVELKVPKQAASYAYSDLVDMLAADGEKIRWGEDFSREQEAKICAMAKNEAVLVRDYPTAVRAFYSMPYEDNPKMCKAYDLIYRGMEVCSGAQRIHLPGLLEQQIAGKGMDPAGFKSYIDAFKYGAPPHAGWSMGLDRITMAVCKLDNIRDAVMFPRDKQRVKP
ncbi:Aspartate--tRNA(Asp/Asn) ligase [uncultured archaeon]|nr:Aspartate--tRNA(Asp/Asn) ligase [uncultured archaeon]